MRRAFLAVLALLTLTAACDSGPVRPFAPDVAARSGLHGRADGMVTVPMNVRATLGWTVDQSAEALEACAPRPGLAEGTGRGEATHLGRFRIVELDHCSVDLAVQPPALDGVGVFRWVAADGSAISGSYEFLFLPPEQGGFFTFFVEAGTGRFHGATGRLEFDAERSGLVECVDALCLDGATLEAAFKGWISIPRP